MKLYSIQGALSRDEINNHPPVMNTVLVAMKHDIEERMALAGAKRVGPFVIRQFWAKGNDKTTPHSWQRTLKRNATARVTKITAMGSK